MSKYKSDESIKTEAFIDSILRIAAVGGFVASGVIAPNVLLATDKPFQELMKRLDDRSRKRKLARTLNDLRYRKLIAGDYQQGITITAKARQRLAKREFQSVKLSTPDQWDNSWRIVFFDIPEEHKSKRDAFAARLRELGFAVLQRSVFVYPHPCREEVLYIAEYLSIAQYVTYIETSYIDNDAPLRKYFHRKLNQARRKSIIK